MAYPAFIIEYKPFCMFFFVATGSCNKCDVLFVKAMRDITPIVSVKEECGDSITLEWDIPGFPNGLAVNTVQISWSDNSDSNAQIRQIQIDGAYNSYTVEQYVTES